jgi:hypothetical protein
MSDLISDLNSEVVADAFRKELMDFLGRLVLLSLIEKTLTDGHQLSLESHSRITYDKEVDRR